MNCLLSQEEAESVVRTLVEWVALSEECYHLPPWRRELWRKARARDSARDLLYAKGLVLIDAAAQKGRGG